MSEEQDIVDEVMSKLPDIEELDNKVVKKKEEKSDFDVAVEDGDKELEEDFDW